MNRTRVLAATAVAAFLVALIALVPARVALRGLASDNIRASGITGTMWHGAAIGASAGAVRLGETTWRVSALSLLLGRLAADVDTRIGEGSARGSLAVTLAGKVICDGCGYDGPVASLKPLAPALGNLAGRLELEIATIEIQDQWPARVTGTARLSGVPLAAAGTSLTTAAPRSSFEAGVNADPVPEDGLIEVAVNDSGGPVELKARLVLTPPGNFEFTGSAKARADAPAEIVSALSALGRGGPDGSTELGLTGTF